MEEIVTLTPETLAGAVTELCRREPRFSPVVARHGLPSLRSVQPGLESLLHIVTEQFLSLQAAHAIWLRVQARFTPFDPAGILACSHDDLMQLGLSAAKARSFHGIAMAAAADPDFFDGLQQQTNADVRRSLIALPGVGPWTAEIYLLGALRRRDAWPVGDLALRIAAGHLFGLPEAPDVKSMNALGESFSPWRSVAARLLWSHYRGLKNLAQAR